MVVSAHRFSLNEDQNIWRWLNIMVLLFVAVLQFLRWCHFLAVRFFLFKITTFILFLLLYLSCMNKPQVPGSLKLHQDKVGHGGWSLMAFSHLQSASQLVRVCKLICFVFFTHRLSWSHLSVNTVFTLTLLICQILWATLSKVSSTHFLYLVTSLMAVRVKRGEKSFLFTRLHPCLVAQESWDSYMTCRKADLFFNLSFWE